MDTEQGFAFCFGMIWSMMLTHELVHPQCMQTTHASTVREPGMFAKEIRQKQRHNEEERIWLECGQQKRTLA